QYTGWLIPLLGLTAAAFMLESYFIGIKDGATLRNGALMGFMVGFVPLVILAVAQQSETVLWAALTGYMGILLGFLGVKLVRSHSLLLAEQASQS
ncbi:MAG: hypothetical protein AAFU71_10665, partial [Cyanobacteria bacterium J06632_22]